MISYLRKQEVDFQLVLTFTENDFLFKGARSRFSVNFHFRNNFLLKGEISRFFQFILTLTKIYFV